MGRRELIRPFRDSLLELLYSAILRAQDFAPFSTDRRLVHCHCI